MNFVVPWNLASPCSAYDVRVLYLMRTEAAREDSSSNYSSILGKFLLPLWARLTHGHSRVADAGLHQNACMQYTKQQNSDTICVIQPHAQDNVDAHLSAAAVEFKFLYDMPAWTPSMALPVIISPSKALTSFNTANTRSRHHSFHIHKATVMQCSCELYQC